MQKSVQSTTTGKAKKVFTNGCFDILHRGHLELLKHCSAIGDRDVVGINSDQSNRRLKRPKRPITSQADRKALLEALSCVDEVIIFEEDTPYELIQREKPDIIVKGSDYKKHEVVGNDIAEVVIFELVSGYSTSGILKKFDR